MKLPRDLSGAELVKVLCKHHGYARVHQEGSHIILQTERPVHHRFPCRTILRCGWQEFFDTYGKLIHRIAVKAGLSDAEAQDVVQETVIVVARKIPGFK